MNLYFCRPLAVAPGAEGVWAAVATSATTGAAQRVTSSNTLGSWSFTTGTLIWAVAIMMMGILSVVSQNNLTIRILSFLWSSGPGRIETTLNNPMIEKIKRPFLSSIQILFFILIKNFPDITIPTGNDVVVYGTAVPNHIIIARGAKVELINFPGQNTIQIQSDSSSFMNSRSGTVVTFTGSNGTVLKIPATRDA